MLWIFWCSDLTIWEFQQNWLAKQFYSYLRTNSQWKTKTITKFAHKQFIDSLPDNHQNETALVYKFQQFGEVSFHFTCVYVTVNNTSRSSVPFFTIRVSQFKFNWLQKNKYFLRLQTLGNTQNYYWIDIRDTISKKDGPLIWKSCTMYIITGRRNLYIFSPSLNKTHAIYDCISEHFLQFNFSFIK